MNVRTKVLAICLSAAAVISAGFASANASSQPRDCDSNAIMRCGAYSASEFKDKYKKNASGDLDNIYKHYGIDVNAIGSAKNGVVKKNGDVVVDGKVVATDAHGVGRQNMSGSHKVTIDGKTYYERYDTRNFLSDIKAFVFFDKDGNFKYAVLKACGNPEMAKPVKKPKPSVECKDLTAKAISRNEYSFTTDASTKNGAKINGYVYNFGDGTTKSDDKTTSHTYSQPGTYTVSVTLKTSLGDIKDKDCEVKVTVKPAAVASCKSLTATISKANDVTLSATAAAENGATIKGYTFTVKDESGKVVFTKDVTSTATTASVTNGFTPGNYSAAVVVHTSEGDKDGDSCKTKFCIPQTPVAACTSLTAAVTNRTNVALSAVASTANGATVNGYVFTIIKGTAIVYTNTVTTNALTASTSTSLEAGDYTANVVVKTSLGDKTGTNCETSFTVKPAPVASCKSLVATVKNREDFTLEASAITENGATVSSYVFNVTDASGKTVYTQTVNSSALNASVNGTLPAGTYTAKVVVNTSLGAKDGTQCTDTFTISEAPLTECKSLTATISNRTNYTLTASASATNGATINGYTFVIKNASGTVVRTASQTGNVLTGTLPAGTYTAQVTVKTSLGDRSGANCATTFTIQPEMCAVPGKETLPKDSPLCYENCTVPGKENLPVNSPDCKETEMCQVPGKENLPKDSDQCYENCTVQGKESLPVNSPDCKDIEKCDVPGKENLPANSDDCVEQELPETGLAGGILGFFGLGSVAAAGAAYIRSRRA